MASRIAFILTLAAWLLPAWADAPESKVTIIVQQRDGDPVARASVIVKFVEGRSVIKLGKKQMTRWEVRTNQEGVAKVPAIPQGKLLVQVIAKGYQTFGQYFEVEGDEKTITVKLNPPQPQYSAH